MALRPRTTARAIVKELGLSKADIQHLRGYGYMLKRLAPDRVHKRFAEAKLIVKRPGGWMLTPKGLKVSRFRWGS
jgi:hypothetical protein